MYPITRILMFSNDSKVMEEDTSCRQPGVVLRAFPFVRRGSVNFEFSMKRLYELSFSES